MIWVASFIFAYWSTTGDETPAFTILGMHPSFAAIVLGYFLAGVAALTGGFYLRRDRWFSDERWREFTAMVEREGRVVDDDL